MGDVKKYATPAAFKAGLEARVNALARAQGRPMNRVRTLAVMERFLARALVVMPESCMLKGGLALELRLDRARTTKDIDLRLIWPADGVGDLLARAAALIVDPDDYLRFTVEADPEHPTIEGDGVVYDGFRFVVTATIAARQYADKFGVDVAFADAVHGPAVELVGSDTFAFVGIEPIRVRAYPVGSHIAEKLHAYTLPRSAERPNSRVKDLPDIALIAASTGLDADDLRAAIRTTFDFMASHPMPTSVPDAPPSWVDRYRKMAQDEDLRWRDLAELLAAARAFLDPVLAGRAGTWDPVAWECG